jgi:hypothetical protein
MALVDYGSDQASGKRAVLLGDHIPTASHHVCVPIGGSDSDSAQESQDSLLEQSDSDR